MNICRHPELKTIDATHSECLACGVWRGVREDAHRYTAEYYQEPAFGLFDYGIPRRTAVYSGYQNLHFRPLGIELDFASTPRVLSIGCGVGLIAYSMFLDGADVDAVDSSEWATKWMAEAYGQHDRFRSWWANFETMDRSLLNPPFDFIYSTHVWEHLDDPMAATEWCLDALKPGGQFFALVPDKQREAAMHHTHAWAFDLLCLERWLADAGFTDIRGEAFSDEIAASDGGGGFLRIVGTKA